MQRSDDRTDTPTGRVARRHKLFEPVEIIVDRLPARAHLLNISATGALVHSAVPPVAGALIALRLPGVEQPARVVWSEASRFGVSFERALSASVLATILR